MADGPYVLQLEFEIPNKEIAKSFYAAMIDVDYEALSDTGDAWGPANVQTSVLPLSFRAKVVSIYPKR